MIYTPIERRSTLGTGEEISYGYLRIRRHVRLDSEDELAKSYLLFSGESPSDKEIELPPLELAIHPNKSGKIVVASPGANNPIDGFGEDCGYGIQQSIGAAVRTANRFPSDLQGQLGDKFRRFCGKVVKDTIRGAIRYSLEHAEEISGSKEPELYLVGYSAGGSGVAAVAHEFPQAGKILLMAPSGDTGQDAFEGIAKYQGHVTVLVGGEDHLLNGGIRYFMSAEKARSRCIRIIKGCGHQFTGHHDQFDQAPLWAFRE